MELKGDIMKKIILVILFLCILFINVGAVESPTNQDIAQTEVINVIPENPDQPVIPPDIQIIEDTEEILELQDDLRPPTYVILFDYETALANGFASNYNVGICFE